MTSALTNSNSSRSPTTTTTAAPTTMKKHLNDGSQGTLSTAAEDDSDDYSSDSDDYSDSDSDSDDDSESSLADLEQELLCFDLQQQRRRRRASANDALLSLITNSNTSRTSTTTTSKQSRRTKATTTTSTTTEDDCSRRKSMPLPTQGNGAQSLFQRMAVANATNSYFQDPNKKDRVSKVGSTSKSATYTTTTTPRPDAVLQDTLQLSTYITADTLRSSSWEPYFTAVTPARIAAHSLNVAQAIRRADLKELTNLNNNTNNTKLNGCNPQGESSMHLACRLGKLSVVQLLVDDCQVSVRVRDDQGKTPLHDACWTTSPNFELVKFILQAAPELLFLTDFRGYTALHYVPDCCADLWIDFITTNQTWLREQVHTSTWLKASAQLDDAQLRMQTLMQKVQEYS